MKDSDILAPWLPKELRNIKEEADFITEAVGKEELILEVVIRGISVQGRDFSRACFSKASFEGCTFLDCSFYKGEFTDVVFHSCNISNTNFGEAYFNRCEMVSSKGLGTKFSDGVIKNMIFADCNLEYANFDSASFEKVKFSETDLSHGAVSQCRFKGALWNRVNLTGASFFKSLLKGMDLTSCTITGLVLSDQCWELKGAAVDLYQAAELAKRLGVIIK